MYLRLQVTVTGIKHRNFNTEASVKPKQGKVVCL
jgi:hypothetical protein